MEEPEDQKQLFSLTISQLGQIMSLGLPLEGVYILECLIEGTNPGYHLPYPRLQGTYQTLTRKGYLSESDELTEEGIRLYKALLDNKDIVEEKEGRVISMEVKLTFEDWWRDYPRHDGFEYNNKVFEKKRPLKKNKEVCKRIFDEYVNKGRFTAKEIIEATAADILLRKQTSVKEGKNALSFLQASDTYIRQASFEPFIGDIPKEDSDQGIYI